MIPCHTGVHSALRTRADYRALLAMDGAYAGDPEKKGFAERQISEAEERLARYGVTAGDLAKLDAEEAR